jgi:hypothetical protein
LGDDAALDHFAIVHGNLARHVEPAIGLDRAGERQMLTAGPAAAFDAISFECHLRIVLGVMVDRDAPSSHDESELAAAI